MPFYCHHLLWKNKNNNVNSYADIRSVNPALFSRHLNTEKTDKFVISYLWVIFPFAYLHLKRHWNQVEIFGKCCLLHWLHWFRVYRLWKHCWLFLSYACFLCFLFSLRGAQVMAIWQFVFATEKLHEYQLWLQNFSFN